MKKVVSVVLALIMTFSLFGVVASAESQELVIAVANDMHYNLKASTAVTKRNSIDEDFFHIGSSGRLVNESVAIISAFLENVGNSDCEYVLIPGDFTETGSKEESLLFAAMLSDFEAKYNKQVYVVPGNHDLYDLTIDEFRAVFAQFGYNEAIEKDTASASYTADLADGYRLIAIDSCEAGESPYGFDDARMDWVIAQAEKAQADGKKPIAMMHHNLIEHFVLGTKIHSGAIVTSGHPDFAEKFAKAGIKYVFTGHTHDQDIASYTAADGTVIYDVVTASLTGPECPYRVVRFGDEVKFETKNVDAIDLSLLPAGISENALKLAESDFIAYSNKATDISYRVLFESYTSAAGLKRLLKTDDAELSAIIAKVADKLSEAIRMPLNKENELEEGKSIESIVAKYDTVIPDSSYTDMLDLAIRVYQAHNLGDEYYPAYSDEVVIVTRSIAAAISYALSDVSGEEYAKVLSYLTSLTGFTVPVDYLIYAGDGMKRFEGIEILVATALLPAITEFTVDNAPGDNNVTLPGYAQLVEEEEELSFWDRIVEFFMNIFDAIRTVFAFLPFWD